MADLVSNLQQIYATKLQIKSAIGTDSDIFSDYPSYISDLKPSGYTYITMNGDHSVNGYAYVNVNVPGATEYDHIDITANSQVDVSAYNYAYVSVPVPPGYVIPEGTINIDTVGTHDVTTYANAYVDIQIPTYVFGYHDITTNGTTYASTYGFDGFTYVNVNVSGGGGSSHSGTSAVDAWTVDEAVSYISAFEDTNEHLYTDLGFTPYVEGVVAAVRNTRSAQYPSARYTITRTGESIAADYSNAIVCWNINPAIGQQTWTEGVDRQVKVGDHVIIAADKLQKYYDSTNDVYQMEFKNGAEIQGQSQVANTLTISQSGTYDVQGYVSVVVDLTPAPAYITNIQYSTGNNDGGVSSQVGDNWTDMTEDPVTGVFSTPASDSTHYNGNNYGGYIGFRAVYSDNSYTYLNVPHGYNNSIRSDTSGVCTEENALVCFTWNDTFTTDYIEINKNDLYFNVHKTPWTLTSYKCSYNSSTGQYDVIDINATPATINNMGAKLSGFENSYFYKFVCTVGYNGRIIQDNIFATEQITLQDSDYTVTLDTAGSYYLTFNSTQLDDKMLSVTFNGAESFNSISASWQEAPFIRISYTSGGTSQSLKLKGDVAGTLTIDSQQVISVYDKDGERWISSDGATCNSSSSGQSISLTQDMEMTAQDSNVTFDAGQYSIVPTINGDSMMIYSVGLNVSYIGANA